MEKKVLRVLVLAHSPNLNQENELPEGLKPVALFMLTDIIETMHLKPWHFQRPGRRSESDLR